MILLRLDSPAAEIPPRADVFRPERGLSDREQFDLRTEAGAEEEAWPGNYVVRLVRDDRNARNVVALCRCFGGVVGLLYPHVNAAASRVTLSVAEQSTKLRPLNMVLPRCCSCKARRIGSPTQRDKPGNGRATRLIT